MNNHYMKIVRIHSIGRKIDWNKPFIPGDDFYSTGTGFFIKHGIILTAYHVVDKSEKIYVNISKLGKEKIEAELISIYPENDLALLRIKHKIINSIGFLELGNSDNVKVGNWAMAIGIIPISLLVPVSV